MRSSESTIGYQIITVLFKQVLKKYFSNLLTFRATCPQSCAKHMCWGEKAPSFFLSVRLFWSLGSGLGEVGWCLSLDPAVLLEDHAAPRCSSLLGCPRDLLHLIRRWSCSFEPPGCARLEQKVKTSSLCRSGLFGHEAGTSCTSELWALLGGIRKES